MEEVDYKKKLKNMNIIFISLFVIIVFVWGIKSYSNIGWTSGEFECLNWGIYDKVDFEKGVYCIMESCSNPEKDDKLNTLIRYCTCPRNNETIKEYCAMKARVQKFEDGFEPTAKEVNEAVKKLEIQYNTTLKELYIKENQ